ncbi:MAG: serine/threonine protein kinase, partial [Planctomycetes bacterium]|nr:serine/threonine protein kinase [Planctomycetota bacterium]
MSELREAIVLDFLAEYVADREEGCERTLAEYLARFPGAECEIAREYLAGAGGSESVVVTRTLFAGRHASRTLDLPEVDPTRRYEILDLIGVGGMGEVYRAHDRLLDREVAVKFARGDDYRRESMGEAILAEALTAGRLEHPHVPPVHDVGIDVDGRVFYVMRRIAGETLESLLTARESGSSPISLARLLVLFRQLGLAVDHGHARGVLHLDIKPTNVLVGETDDLYLIDWGVSRTESADPDVGTEVGVIRGTPGYMSPEQARGEATLTTASDVYSLGLILYRIVTGVPAYSGDPCQAIAAARRGEIAHGDGWRSLDEGLRSTIEASLARSTRRRTASARALADAVQEFLDGTREKERAARAARAAHDAAVSELRRRRRANAEAERLRKQAERSRPDSWTSIDEKRSFWALEDRARRAGDEARTAGEEAMLSLVEAHRNDPSDLDVRRALGELYWERFVEAEERRDRFPMRFYRGQIEDLDLDEFRERLAG